MTPSDALPIDPALSEARKAHALIKIHIAECDKREERRLREVEQMRSERQAGYQEIKDSIAKVHRRVDSLLARWMTALSVVIGVLFSIIAYIVTKGLPWQG